MPCQHIPPHTKSTAKGRQNGASQPPGRVRGSSGLLHAAALSSPRLLPSDDAGGDGLCARPSNAGVPHAQQRGGRVRNTLVGCAYYVCMYRIGSMYCALSSIDPIDSHPPYLTHRSTHTYMCTQSYKRRLAAAPKEAPTGSQLLEEVGNAPLLRASDGKEVGEKGVCFG